MAKEATYYTISQAINSVRSELKKFTNDTLTVYSNRFIYGKLKKYRNLLLKRDADRNRLRNSNAIQTLTCLNLETVDMIECCDGIDSGYNVTRSTYKIPKFLDSIMEKKYIRVYDMLRTNVYEEKSPEVIIQQKKMKYKYPALSFYIRNNYLYIDGMDRLPKKPEKVLIDCILESPEDAYTFNICEEDACCNEGTCIFVPMLQREFNCPGHLQAVVEQMTVEELIKTATSLQQDKENESKDTSMN